MWYYYVVYFRVDYVLVDSGEVCGFICRNCVGMGYVDYYYFIVIGEVIWCGVIGRGGFDGDQNCIGFLFFEGFFGGVLRFFFCGENVVGCIKFFCDFKFFFVYIDSDDLVSFCDLCVLDGVYINVVCVDDDDVLIGMQLCCIYYSVDVGDDVVS